MRLPPLPHAQANALARAPRAKHARTKYRPSNPPFDHRYVQQETAKLRPGITPAREATNTTASTTEQANHDLPIRIANTRNSRQPAAFQPSRRGVTSPS
jgi:hypothetical protein